MEITGIIIQALPMRSGTNQSGEWKAQTFVLQTTDCHPRYFAFDVYDGRDGRLARYGIQTGKKYTVFFTIRAHEFNGRWYNQVFTDDVREATE